MTEPAPVTQRYDGVAIALHWIIAFLILANLTLGLSMVALPISPRKLHWYLWHKSIGVSVFALTSVRLGWRATHLPPAPVPPWQQRASAWSHRMLYLLLFAVPLSGYLYSSAAGVQVVWLEAFPLPDLVPKDKALGDVLRVAHVGLNVALATLAVLHVAAALKHRFVDRDTVLARMLPFKANRTAPR
ncbi:MAG: cytochrome b [Betaproteobacteria bacterium]